MPSPWTASDIPDQSGRTIIVTGANSGIGLEASCALAAKGARVIMACRNLEKGEAAAARVRADAASPPVLMELDLSSLASVRAFAETFLAENDRLDVLCNNAGVMAIPRADTADGFEMQLGTNHLGHFALTGLLLERLVASGPARVVSVSSTAHRMGRIHFDDLQSERRYGKWGAYCQSKLANLLFIHELGGRLEQAGAPVVAVACHPGYASTNLQAVGPRLAGSRLLEQATVVVNRIFSQSAAMGAQPTLRAATAPDVAMGDYYGPSGFTEIAGPPQRVGSSAASRDATVAARLWECSTELTGVDYPLN